MTSAPTTPPGPLEEYLGWSSPESKEQFVADQAWREDRTAQCMADQGFEYWPLVPIPGSVTQGSGPFSGTPEYVAAYGYGVWRSPDGDYTFGLESDLTANQDYRAAMSEAEGAAYDEAYYGHDTGDGTGIHEGGCIEAATNPVGGAATQATATRDDAIAFLAGLSGDARFAEVDAAWASCMTDLGYTFGNPQAAQDSVAAAWDAAHPNGQGPGADVAAAGAQEELRVAVADYSCRDSSHWTTRHREIEVELQQEYVDAHRADLDALVAALPQPSGG